MNANNLDDRPDPENDPFACSICGQSLGELKRIENEHHCDACQREYGGLLGGEL